jgi:hypothetical protein
MKKSCNKQEGKLAYPYEPALSNLSCVFRFPEDMRAARAVAWAFEWPFRILFGYVCKLPLLFLRSVNFSGVLQAAYLTETSEDACTTLQRFNNWRRTTGNSFFRIRPSPEFLRTWQVREWSFSYVTSFGCSMRDHLQHSCSCQNGMGTHSIAQMHRIYTLDS